MTNTEAIKKLDQQKTLLCFDCMHPQTVEWCEEHCQGLEAYNMAINALKAEEQLAKNSSKVDKESGELISRQAAIDFFRRMKRTRNDESEKDHR